MNQVTINITSDTIVVVGPYSEKNNDTWRSLGGKFRNGAWHLPDNETARTEIAAMFGKRSEDVQALVPSSILKDGKTIQIGGYVLARRRYRDSPVTLENGVTLARGAFSQRGGSVKSPSISLDSDVIFVLTCRQAFAEANNLEIAHDNNNNKTVEI